MMTLSMSSFDLQNPRLLIRARVEHSKTPIKMISEFHKIVLNWDYRLLGKNETNLDLKKVKETYEDIDDYIETYESLLFEEVKAQIIQRKDKEDEEWTQGIIFESSITDDIDGFYSIVVGYDCEEGETIAENDLLLLSNNKILHNASYVFALVLNREGRDRLKLRLGRESCSILLKNCSVFIESNCNASNRLVWISKIASLSTIIREYVGLRSIVSLSFKELILSAAESDSAVHRSWKIPTPLEKFFEGKYNPSQISAIHDVLSSRAFVLIQGPPGTGKTYTIIGLLSAVLHSTPARVESKKRLRDEECESKLDCKESYKHWKVASPWLYDTSPRDKIMPIDGDDGLVSSNELRPEVVNLNRKYRVRVLVCAPSNSALDEILLRVLETGIWDENGRAYNPKVVRIGLKPHHDVQRVSLDYLVEKKIAERDATSVDADRDSIRASVLHEAAIVFSTLSFSGSALFSKLNYMFDVVIIDEAAQAVEPATLVPLVHGCSKVILVGDPKQLPATVISSTAKDFRYEMSLFERFQRANYPVQLLKTQYRMHPEISQFPSQEFYVKKTDASEELTLEDDPGVEHQTERPWHVYRCFGPFAFFNISGVESKPSGSSSWINVDEVEFIILMYHKLVSKFPVLKSSNQLAIISPYGDQVKLLRDRFRKAFGDESDKLVDISTVDGFQGRQTDVAIFSCVRANEKKHIGFLKDPQRMNVAITRAKSSLLVVGSSSTLEGDTHWDNLVKSAEKRECKFRVSRPYDSFVSDENLEMFRVKQHTEEKENNAAMSADAVGEPEQRQLCDDDCYGEGDDGGFGNDYCEEHDE